MRVPDELADSDDDRENQSGEEYDEDAADVGDRQGVGVLLALLVDVALTRTTFLLPPLVVEHLENLFFLES